MEPKWPRRCEPPISARKAAYSKYGSDSMAQGSGGATDRSEPTLCGHSGGRRFRDAVKAKPGAYPIAARARDSLAASWGPLRLERRRSPSWTRGPTSAASIDLKRDGKSLAGRRAARLARQLAPGRSWQCVVRRGGEAHVATSSALDETIWDCALAILTVNVIAIQGRDWHVRRHRPNMRWQGPFMVGTPGLPVRIPANLGVRSDGTWATVAVHLGARSERSDEWMVRLI